MILSMHVLEQPGIWFVAIYTSGMKPCMQDTFARACTRPRPMQLVGQARRATIGYLVYKRATIGYLVYNMKRLDITNSSKLCSHLCDRS